MVWNELERERQSRRSSGAPGGRGDGAGTVVEAGKLHVEF
jgi:hypothetical protein